MRCYHPFGWRDFQDFGNGALGDFGCHILDPVFTALKIATGPKNLTAEHSGMNDEVWPAQTKVRYTFPGTELTVDGDLPISWYDGGLLPSVKSDVPASAALPRSGSLLIGEQGTMIIPHVGPMQV
ncbi:MAG: gfo/Idh/MocA family oxidoreductase, partial [Planctomycetales bacterium]|nr:gfo/Idh/MocA family oxidoreductase [Planctomycetales bacterium]